MSIDRWDGLDAVELARLWQVPRVEVWASIASTSDRAAHAAREGCPPWTVVVADEQTAGRGRRGDPWHSAPGAGIWMTMVVPPHLPDYPIPLIVGAACVDALDALAPSVRPAIKWPNDLHVDDRKLGGILCEARGNAVLIGVGINTARPPGGFPEGLDPPPAALEDVAANSLLRRDLAGAIISGLREYLTQPDGVTRSHNLLVARDALLGRTVRSEEHGTGVARGIDRSGRLVLERADGKRVVVGSGRVRVQDETRRSG